MRIMAKPRTISTAATRSLPLERADASVMFASGRVSAMAVMDRYSLQVLSGGGSSLVPCTKRGPVSKASSAYELSLGPRAAGETLTGWPYAELRRAILDGRLIAGTRLPPTREFAAQHGLSRGTVVSVFERLEGEGYLSGRVGSGTTVNRLATATR